MPDFHQAFICHLLSSLSKKYKKKNPELLFLMNYREESNMAVAVAFYSETIGNPEWQCER